MKKRRRKPTRHRAKSGSKPKRLPKDAVTQTVILRAKEGQILLLEAELRALVGPTRREEGCLQYDLYRSVDPASAFLLHEVWASREHHTAHTKSPHFLRWNARKDALLASREATFWEQLL